LSGTVVGVLSSPAAALSLSPSMTEVSELLDRTVAEEATGSISSRYNSSRSVSPEESRECCVHEYSPDSLSGTSGELPCVGPAVSVIERRLRAVQDEISMTIKKTCLPSAMAARDAAMLARGTGSLEFGAGMGVGDG
jgi:hypothetical protein